MCTVYIYRHIMRLPPKAIFTTRELLPYGRRGAVDQALYRMVKSQFLTRLARGVFIRNGSFKPTAFQIAKAKAEAFGKKLFDYGQDLLIDLKLVQRVQLADTIYATDAHSTSFETIRGRVYLKGIGPRKVKLCHTSVGRIAYALWHLGERMCTREDVATASYNMRRTEREQFRLTGALIPAWLNDLCTYRYPQPRVP